VKYIGDILFLSFATLRGAVTKEARIWEEKEADEFALVWLEGILQRGCDIQ